MSTPPMTAEHIERILAIATTLVALAAFAASLPLTAGSWGGEGWPGALILAMGWWGLIFGVFGWYANPLWALALLFLLVRLRVPAVVASSITLLIALTSVQLVRGFPADMEVPFDYFGPGFYLWLFAMATPLIGSIALLTRPRATRPSP